MWADFVDTGQTRREWEPVERWPRPLMRVKMQMMSRCMGMSPEKRKIGKWGRDEAQRMAHTRWVKTGEAPSLSPYCDGACISGRWSPHMKARRLTRSEDGADLDSQDIRSRIDRWIEQ